MKSFSLILIFLYLVCPLVTAKEVELIGDVDNQTKEELLAYFRDGVKIFAGGYITDEFEPGLDRYVVAIENRNGSYTVITADRPCKRTEFYLLKICFRDRCHWDLDATYLCIHE